MNKLFFAALVALFSLILTACGGGGEVIAQERPPTIIDSSLDSVTGTDANIGDRRPLGFIRVLCPHEYVQGCTDVSMAFAIDGANLPVITLDGRSFAAPYSTVASGFEFLSTFTLGDRLAAGEVRTYNIYGTMYRSSVRIRLVGMLMSVDGGYTVGSPAIVTMSDPCFRIARHPSCPG